MGEENHLATSKLLCDQYDLMELAKKVFFFCVFFFQFRSCCIAEINSFVHKLAFVVWAKFVSFFCFLFNWDSWSHKKKKHKKIKAYSKSF